MGPHERDSKQRTHLRALQHLAPPQRRAHRDYLEGSSDDYAFAHAPDELYGYPPSPPYPATVHQSHAQPLLPPHIIPRVLYGAERRIHHCTQDHPYVFPMNPYYGPPLSSQTLPAPSRYRPRRKDRKSHIPRPPNAFMLFRSHFLRQTHHVEKRQQHLSRLAGEEWHRLPGSERDRWTQHADYVAQRHQEEFPYYKYTPRRRGGGGTNTDFEHTSARLTVLACDANSEGSKDSYGIRADDTLDDEQTSRQPAALTLPPLRSSLPHLASRPPLILPADIDPPKTSTPLPMLLEASIPFHQGFRPGAAPQWLSGEAADDRPASAADLVPLRRQDFSQELLPQPAAPTAVSQIVHGRSGLDTNVDVQNLSQVADVSSAGLPAYAEAPMVLANEHEPWAYTSHGAAEQNVLSDLPYSSVFSFAADHSCSGPSVSI
ncbi:uncharacterized protein SCHCODRAFT_02671423 [Schizophyllum commune H4-8]|nr:uncharacterized protein SCHCODRAFT_02674004 [Schizophyllum commune H4-8]XP_003027895.1 uncharacterized protein SCHCODRAFT_02672468 [Schizophyllum commune H4-8]XP_003028504.1 uncharacterized protein SCHCODRAFT_02671423 [Schizophyllum commune H4-8]KAI5836660.1 hypothetical protein SCHCODRAFT_02674004 [Schizophyllum commune H4-8]KAI5887350.1 hypothetical protein SCHCODRAFT_02672468 [Schizophyllum commune H4-8]KAI5888893.1 hypothetical protein SCHCODRAFT_02671423 [Schizophyllum commune H4-8]